MSNTVNIEHFFTRSELMKLFFYCHHQTFHSQPAQQYSLKSQHDLIVAKGKKILETILYSHLQEEWITYNKQVYDLLRECRADRIASMKAKPHPTGKIACLFSGRRTEVYSVVFRHLVDPQEEKKQQQGSTGAGESLLVYRKKEDVIFYVHKNYVPCLRAIKILNCIDQMANAWFLSLHSPRGGPTVEELEPLRLTLAYVVHRLCHFVDTLKSRHEHNQQPFIHTVRPSQVQVEQKGVQIVPDKETDEEQRSLLRSLFGEEDDENEQDGVDERKVDDEAIAMPSDAVTEEEEEEETRSFGWWTVPSPLPPDDLLESPPLHPIPHLETTTTRKKKRKRERGSRARRSSSSSRTRSPPSSAEDPV
jgi:hypothetical protein